MGKSRKPSGKAKAKARAKKTVVSKEPSRRDFLQLSGFGALGLVAVGGAGAWAVSGIRAVAKEQDLSRLGQGIPAIVQVHDPQCAMCTELQRQTRKALKCLDEDEFVYLVASIRTEDGSAFAAMHGVPHVTLMLMDGDGSVQNILNGVRQSDELKPIFDSHVRPA